MNKINVFIFIVLGFLIISCNKKPKEETTVISKDVKETLQKYAVETKGVLGKNLMNAINTQGTEKAIEFCSTRAIVLTDSMGTAFNATLKRVSDKPRNPVNKANDNETAFINELKQKISKGEKMTPKFSESDGKITGYFPIETNAMCLQCHGSKDLDIKPNVLKKIVQLYPNDQATGYKENQIRGIFVVTQKQIK
ncbi:hypothetical protein C3L50_11945 [Flavobacterium alvei]|uniref:Tll0287-like domain-containing protein n=1 Tax=Flavobacterium alvei TaxID=2080416 RepID=A0A2S5A9N3_9FLAO|nr:DUF3365 domain-containing protein [Flavobacterium alvei]POY38833.1 hypothetical protein C3L50_11945 [Flavobacterium alvei]